MKKKSILLMIIAILFIIPMTVFAVSISLKVELVGKNENIIEVGEEARIRANYITTNDMIIPDDDTAIGSQSIDDVTEETTWESSNNAIAIVRDGKLIGIAPGEVTITGSYGSSQSQTDSITVTVRETESATPDNENDTEQLTDIPDTFAKKDMIILIFGVIIAIAGSSLYLNAISKQQKNQ